MTLTIALPALLILGATTLGDSWFRSACRWLLLLVAVEASLHALYAMGFQSVGPFMIGVPG